MTPKLLFFALLSVFATSATAWKRIPRFAILPGRGGVFSFSGPEETHAASAAATKKAMGFFSAYVTKLFNEADTNKDGTLNPQEVYELVLKFYITVNRQAPIRPPSRKRVMILLDKVDKSKNGGLEIDEFRRLLTTLYARGGSRVGAHKLVSLFVAPVGAISLVNMIKGRPYLIDLFTKGIPVGCPEKMIETLTKESLWVTVFTVAFVTQLAKMALSFVDWLWWGNNADDKMYENCDELKEKV